MFTEAIDAIQHGDNIRGQDLLARLLRIDKDNPEYWLWMSSVVNSSKEQEYCLENVLRVEPENKTARRGLILMGKLPTDDVKPVPPIRRIWEADIGKEVEDLKGFQKVMANPVLRIVFFLGAAFFATGLILAGIFGTRGIFKPKLTITPVAWTLTPTNTLTITPKVRTPTPTPLFSPTPEPLWMLLDATYTPVPLYVDTPHPRLEAYRLAIRAFENGDYQRMLNFLEQTLRDEPEAADLYYLVGEAYRLSGDPSTALNYYENSLAINSHFAPAYLSKAFAKLSINPRYDISEEVNSALENDPRYVDAYLTRAIYFYSQNDLDAALKDLDTAVQLMPTDPRLYMEMANVYLALGENKLALENAQKAHELDITLLPAYLVLGKAYLKNDKPNNALEKIETYGLYYPDDPVYLALLGAVYYEIGSDYDLAMTLLDRAKLFGEDEAIVHYYHGLTALALDDPKQAVNDFYVARSLELNNYDYNIWFGIALFEDERFSDAYNQILASESFARSDEQFAIFYYYKAKSGIKLSQFDPAEKAWLSLLELPQNTVPAAWIIEAEQYLAPPTETPTPTNTPTTTTTPTKTMTPTRTPTPTSTETLTPSLTKAIPSSTPSP